MTTNQGTNFRKGSCDKLENRDRVDIQGHRQPDGSVLAIEVELQK